MTKLTCFSATMIEYVVIEVYLKKIVDDPPAAGFDIEGLNIQSSKIFEHPKTRTTIIALTFAVDEELFWGSDKPKTPKRQEELLSLALTPSLRRCYFNRPDFIKASVQFEWGISEWRWISD